MDLTFFFTIPVSKAKYFSTIWHLSPRRIWAQEEKEHFMVECVTIS